MPSTPSLAKGKAKVGYVLPEKLIRRIKLRAIDEKVRPSHVVEALLTDGLKRNIQFSEGQEPVPA